MSGTVVWTGAMGSNQNVKAKRNKRGARGLKKVRHHKRSSTGMVGDGSTKFMAPKPLGAKQKRGQP